MSDQIGVPPPPDGGQGEAVPVCPRHPDRVSYVRCQRCGRPTCPQCQRPAPVGVQCVDCVAAASRTTAPRALFGEGRVSARPVVTLTIVAACVVVNMAQRFATDVTVRAAFIPSWGAQEPWRFLTAAFTHSTDGFWHILFNMIALWTVGPFLETALGRARYVTLYLLSAIGASTAMVVWAWMQPSAWNTVVVGASGAVFGLFGAVLVVLRRTGRSAGGIVGVIVLNAVIGFVVPGIAWQAHLGGLVVGAVLGAAYAYAPRPQRRMVSVAASVAIAVVLVAVATGIYLSVGLL